MNLPAELPKRDWCVRFIVSWIAQEEKNPETVEEELIAATFERCLKSQERNPLVEFSLNASTYLDKAAKRLATRLFSERQPVRGETLVNVALPYPFIDNSLELFAKWSDENSFQSYQLDFDEPGEKVTRVIHSSDGERTDVHLFRHHTMELRRLSLGRKINEVIRETVSRGFRQSVDDEAAVVRDLTDLIASRDRGILAVEARLMLRRIAVLAGPEHFIDWLWKDNLDFLRDNPDLFPPSVVRARILVLENLNDAAQRKAKSRAFGRIQVTVKEPESGGTKADPPEGRAKGAAADS